MAQKVNTILYKIIYSSNVAQGAAKDTAALNKKNATVQATNAAAATSSAVTTKQASATRKARTAQEESKVTVGQLFRAMRTLNFQTMKNIDGNKLFKKGAHTAGLNIGKLSVRIHEGLVPILIVAVAAMLPVVAALLAIGSAALVAGAGLAGVMGIGLWAWGQRARTSMIWGARSSGDDQNVMDMAMRGMREALRAPEIRDRISWAVEVTQEIFSTTLPKAFKNFISSVDGPLLAGLVNMFQRWLPVAATNLAEFGNALYRMIGQRSLQNVSNFISYMADGLRNTARWLSTEGGFEQVEYFTSTVGKVISLFMSLGKSTLPLLARSLSAVYPMPLRPVIMSLTSFFSAIERLGLGGAVENITRLGVAVVMITMATKMIYGLGLLIWTTAKVIKYAVWYVIFRNILALISRLQDVIVNLIKFWIDTLRYYAGKMPGFDSGVSERPSMIDAFDPLRSGHRYGGIQGMFADWFGPMDMFEAVTKSHADLGMASREMSEAAQMGHVYLDGELVGEIMANKTADELESYGNYGARPRTYGGVGY